MSNTLGRNLINTIFCRRNSLDNQTRVNYILPGAIQPTLQLRKSLFPTRFTEHLRLRGGKASKEAKHIPAVVPCAAVLAMDPSPGLAGKFKLGGNSELLIDVTKPTTPAHTQINFQVTNNKNSLTLHWGGIRDGQKKWVLPSHKSDGTNVYNNQALRTPFKRLGSDSFLKIEIDSHDIHAIEFLIFDETHNKWLKNNGENFFLKLLRKDDSSLNVAIPEDLVQIQAYLRWERKGKQQYTPEQQKMEFEEARKELQFEIEKGSSLEELRKKITKGKNQSNVSKQVPKKYSTPTRIQRKQRDAMQLLNKYVPEFIEQNPSHLSQVELFSKAKEEKADGSILNKQIFKLADKTFLVLVTKPLGKMKVHMATDLSGPLTLHWAVSKKPGEWQAPPLSLVPQGSVMLESASETPFTDSSSNDPHQVQSLEIDIGEENYVGMPFVLRSGRNWIKNGGSDFYVEFSPADKFKKDVGDGKGTAKSLLEKIAELEREAQKSFMHRFNIAADLIGWAKDFGEVGFAGIFVWMRFMATRQLIWNKNYNVKPREISKAKDRLTDFLQHTYKSGPQHRELLRMIMATVGRGGEGDVGQRIRDEILVIQTLIDYIKSGFDVNAYWKTLHSNGITKERLLSYDRAIHSEQDLRREHKDRLLRDL